MANSLERMQCMEIWGGNEPVRSAVGTAGLDVEVASRPAGESSGGGDLHFVSSCASGRITRFVLADVCGHGDAIAAVARDVRDLMRRSINHVDQTRFVSSLNRRIAELGGGELFATAIVGTFFVTTRRLAICNAGHPPPLFRRRDDAAWGVLPGPPGDRAELANIPLGIMGKIPYRETVLQFQPGDQLLAYTDAASETRGEDGEFLGLDGVRTLVDGLEAEPATLLDRLAEALDARRGGPADDDESFLLIGGNAESSRWADTLLAPLRMAGNAMSLRRPRPRPRSATPTS
jgi:serine phosphatase RsbU (regulator of sigma subunit)